MKLWIISTPFFCKRASRSFLSPTWSTHLSPRRSLLCPSSLHTWLREVLTFLLKFPLILETKLYMLSFRFFGNPRINSTMQQYLTLFPYSLLCIALTLPLFKNIGLNCRNTKKNRFIGMCCLGNTVTCSLVSYVCLCCMWRHLCFAFLTIAFTTFTFV